MTRRAFALVALMIAILGGTSRAQAIGGGTYRIAAGGDQNWTPSSGAIDQSSGDKMSATGTLTGNNNAVGSVDYELASGPGITRAKLNGSVTVPSGLFYPFNPSLQSVSMTELTVSGPAGEVTTSVNLHVDGIIDTPVCGSGSFCGAENVQIQVGPFTRVSEFDTLPETRANQLGLAFDPVPGGYRVHGDVTSAQFAVTANNPVPVSIVLNLSGRYAGSPAPSTFGGNFDDPAALYQVSFAPTGPVLNDIPAGYTVSGESVVDNRWTDPFTGGGPVDTTPPSVVGVPDRAPNFFGWYREPVTIDWQASDDSGQASDPPDTVAGTDGKDVAYTSGQSCDPSGNCATGSFMVSLDRVAPTVTCPQPAPVFELNGPLSAIEPSASDSLSGIVGGSVGFPDVSSVGQKSITFTFEDKAGNTTTVTCDYTVVDTLPPSVVGTPDRAPNFFGWYREPVTIDWQASDDSGQASDPPDTVAGTDGKDVAYTSGQSCDPSGNCATGSFMVSLDRVAPTVTCPQPAPVFELNGPLSAIEPSASDSLSGIVGGSVGFPDVSSVGQKSITFTFEDKAGNTTTVTCAYTVLDPGVDTTPPVVAVPGNMAVDATSPAGAKVTYTASATDDRDASPSLVCAPASGSNFPIGTTTAACTAKDAAGNSASATFTVQVRSASEQLVRLRDKTFADLDRPALAPVFRAELQAVQIALAARAPGAACVALNVYIASVRVAPSGTFTAAEKADLIADATRIRAVIGCS